MNSVDLKNLVETAGKMALSNVWGENAYEINMAILEIDPNNCAAYTRLAKYYKLSGNIDEAKNMYIKALEIDPKNWGATNNLHDIEKDQKESDTVNQISTMKELLKEGQSSIAKGRYKLAAKIFARVYSMEPSLANAVSLAGVYKELGQYDKIEKLYSQVVSDNPKKADVKAIDNEFKMFRESGKSLDK